MMILPEDLWMILRDVQEAGGTPYLVGGCVRDWCLQTTPDDYDVEVFGLSVSQLEAVLKRHGKVSAVGESFGVLLVGDHEFSLPRRERCVGKGHKDFEVSVNPHLSLTEAAARRDFTINSMMYNPFTHALIDAYGGKDDLKWRMLRAVGPSFSDDALRVLRGMRFAAQLNFTVEAETAKMCRQLRENYSELPKERVWKEWYKWTQATYPATGLIFLQGVYWLSLYPEIHNVWNTPQHLAYHPEGRVGTHLLNVCNAAAQIAEREAVAGEDRAVLLLAALTHDLGKATTTVFAEGKWKSPGHAEAGVPIAEKFLASIGCFSRIAERVLPLVQEHMFDTAHKVSPRALRRLMTRLGNVSLLELHRLMEADNSGRPPLPAGPSPGSNQLLEMQVELRLPPKIEPLLKGRHLLLTGKFKQGPLMGEVLKEAFEDQLDGAFDTEEGAKQWLDNYIRERHA